MENVKGSRPPRVDIIPQLLLGIWYINSALEKHYSRSESLHDCTTVSVEVSLTEQTHDLFDAAIKIKRRRLPLTFTAELVQM